MNTLVKPLSYGVRKAIKDSPKTTYEIGKLSKVSPQNLYRFLDESGTRGLSQKSLDSLGLRLGLTLVNMGRAEGLLRFHPPILDKTRKPLPEGTLLTDYLRRAFESSHKLVPEIAKAIDVSPTQFYRFLDKTRGLSLEIQIASRNCGDLWVYDAQRFDGQHSEGRFGRVLKKLGNEKPIGEWNTYDIRCEGRKIGVTLNGKVVNEATSDRPIRGKIGLISQGTEVEFRDVRLRTIRR
jgi:hypothetical protein